MGLQDAASGLQRRLGSSSSLLWATPLGFNPATLFGTTDTGWFYDLSDMSTLFQEAAGTTPVTAVAQPVGLCLDKSKRLVLGPELVTNGDFSNGTTGWTVVGAGVTQSVVGGALRLSASASNTGGTFQDVALSGGRYAEIKATIRRVSGSSACIFSLWSFGAFTSLRATIVTVGTTGDEVTYTARFPADASGFRVYFQAQQGDGVFSIDNVSVRELPGNHSSQSTPSFRGVLQGSPSRLVLDGSDDRYVTTLNPTASGTIAARIRGATASRVVAGSQGATDGRALLALAADGSIAAGIGAQSTAVIKGTVDKRNVWVTACVTWNGTTVRLYEDGAEVYSGAQSGAVNTTVPFIYGALNANGTATAFWDDDIGASLVISRAITATEAVQLHNAWRNIA